MDRNGSHSNYTAYRLNETDKLWTYLHNEDWHKVDQEFRKELLLRKELVHTKPMEKIKKQVDAMRATKEFKNIEKDWRQQV